jgi:hypothetical protein
MSLERKTHNQICQQAACAVKLRERGTRKTHTVYVTKETDALYVGDALGDIVCDHRAFLKERYEVVPEQESDWTLRPLVFIGGLLVLGILVGCIIIH